MRFISVILVPVLTGVFPPVTYGSIELLIAAVTLLNIVFVLGFDTSIAILYFETKDQSRQRAIMTTGSVFAVGLSLLCIIILFPFAPFFSHLLFRTSSFTHAIQLALATIPFLQLNGFALASLRYAFSKGRYLLSVILNVFLMISLTIFFLTFFSFGVSGYFLAWLLSASCSSLLTLALARRQYRFAFDKSVLRSLLRLGIPLIPAGLAGWSLALIDRLFLNVLTPIELGWYSLAVKISSILGLCVAALQLAWGPFALSLSQRPEAKVIFVKVLTYFNVAGVLAAVALGLFAPEIISIVSQPAYVPAAKTVGLLALGLVAYGAYYIVSIGSFIAQKTSHISWTTTAAAIVNIALNFLLIPQWGMFGAAIATLVAYVVSAWLLYRMSQRFYPIVYERKKIIVLWIFGLLGVIATIVFPSTVTPLFVLLKCITLLALAFLFVLFRIIELDELRALRDMVRSTLQQIHR